MSNSYYNHTTYPTPNSPGSSAALRAELQAVTSGFDLLPTLTGNGYKVAMVNATGTALIASATLQSLTITGSSIDSTTIGGTTPAPGSFTTLSATGNITLGDADTDTITQSASYVTGTQFKSAKVATNTLSLAAYDVDGAAYTNLVTLTASNTPTLALTSTGVGTINNMSIGATTASTGAFTTLSSTGNTTLGDADTDTITQAASYVTGTQLKSAKVATNTLNLAAYDVDGAAYTNLITLTASNTPTLALTSTGVGTINNMSIGATTASTGAFTDLTTTGNTTIGDASADTVTINGTVQPGVVISGTSTGNALRVTQLGTGNALLVEDSTNPDASPFVIDSSGRVIQGYTTSIITADDYTGTNRTAWGYQGNSANTAGALFTSWNTFTTSGAGISLSRSRSATVGTQGIVSSGDSLGGIGFNGDDGTNFIAAASISAEVDGTPGTNDMPGRLVFSTTADGASTPTERVRISSTGQTTFNYNAIISVTDNTNAALRVTQLGTGNAILVEDSANPDSTPFVIDATGRVVVGSTAAINFPDIQGTQRIIPTQVLGNAYANSSSGIASFINSSSSGGALTLAQSRNTTIGSHTIVNSGDTVGSVQFAGSDGTNFIRAASITAVINGTPGTNDMPGRLVFSTTPAGSDTPVERARITTTGLSLATGVVYQINSVDVLSATTLGSTVTGSSLTSVGTIATGTWQGTVIGATYGGTGINNGARTLAIDTNAGTIAFPGASTTMTFPSTSQTLAGLGLAQTFTAAQTFRAASAVRSEAAATQDAIVLAGRAGGTGSFAATITTDTLAASVTHTLPAITGTLATLANTSQTFTGSTSIIPTNNSANITIGAIPQTGTITVDRSQATHTLDIGVGPTLSGNTKTINFGTAGVSGSTTNINIGSAVSGSTTTTAVNGNVSANYQANSDYFVDINNPFAGTYTTAKFVGIRAKGFYDNLGTAAPFTNYSGYLGWADTGTGFQSANFKIYTSDSSGNQVNIFSASSGGDENTAVGLNALAANTTGTNNTAGGSGALFSNVGGADNTAFGYNSLGSNLSGSGNIALGKNTLFSNGTGGFNTAIGNSALVVSTGSQNTALGQNSGSGITTGSNNVILGSYTGAAAPISATGNNWIVLSDGQGNVRQSFDSSGNSQMVSGAAVVYCPTPSTITATATLTNADILAQIVNTTGATAYTVTLPLGTDLETLIPWSSVDLGYDFYIINSVPANITIAANTGVTIVGRAIVGTNISAQFRIRRTAANTFIVYRIN